MPVLGDESLAVLQRAKKGGLGIVIEVELLHVYAIAPRLEQAAQRRGGHALASEETTPPVINTYFMIHWLLACG